MKETTEADGHKMDESAASSEKRDSEGIGPANSDREYSGCEDSGGMHSEELPLVRVILEEDFWLIGYVVEDAVRLLDVVENGQSAAAITGTWQRLKPVTFDYLRAHGFGCHVEPHNQPLPALEPPERWPTPAEVWEWNV